MRDLWDELFNDDPATPLTKADLDPFGDVDTLPLRKVSTDASASRFRIGQRVRIEDNGRGTGGRIGTVSYCSADSVGVSYSFENGSGSGIFHHGEITALD